MTMKLKIGLVTVNRSDFGIQKKLIKELNINKKIDLHLIVTGSHFDKKYGYTANEILEDKIKINHKFKINLKNDDNFSISKYFSQYINFFGKIFVKNKLDNIIILGDRYEMLAAAVASRIFNISITHLHGGEVTLGAQDEYFRHAISKLANIHFVSLKAYKSRLIKMGEQPKNIIVSGAPSLDNIETETFLKRKELEKKFNIKFNRYNFILTFHPETLNPKKNLNDFNIILNTIKRINDCQFIITSPAPDINSLKMIKLLEKKYTNIKYIKSLGRTGYFSLLKQSDGLIGNSSSGIIEAASFYKFVINVGSRQDGRIQSKNIINCKCNKFELNNAIIKLKKLKKNKKIKNIYFIKNSSKIILNNLIKFLIKKESKNFKKFYDFKK